MNPNAEPLDTLSLKPETRGPRHRVQIKWTYNRVLVIRPDAVLTDIRMPADDREANTGGSMEGIEAAHAIKAEYPSTGIVVLSQYADETYAFELLKRGVAGLAYLLKDRVGDLDRLLHALHEVVAGGSVIDPQVVGALVTRRARIEESAMAQLTTRELDVLREMAQGRANTAIAQALSLSESAVGKHVNSIFAKLGLSSETQLHRRVAAVLTYLRDSGLTPHQRQ